MDSNNNNIILAFIGGVVPDRQEFHSPAFSRAGNMFQENLIQSMTKAGLQPSVILSFLPLPSFPRWKKILIHRQVIQLFDNVEMILMPFLNITPIKQIILGGSVIIELCKWGWKNRNIKNKVVCTYNLTVPPGLFIWIGAKLIGAKTLVFLIDMNVPGETVPNNLINRLDYWMQKKLIPMFDYHISIVDSIMLDFAPGRRYMRLEGGVSPYIFEATQHKLTKQANDPFSIVFAGNLSKENGVEVMLEAFSMLEGDNYRLHIAGKGPLENEAKEAANHDSRIIYHGFKPLDEILNMYNSADVLVNMRLTKEVNTRYFFPSKMMEYTASGTPVVTTCTAHVEEEYKDFVYLLKDETPLGLANLLKQVSTTNIETRKNKGKKAREYMLQNKTWDAQGRKVISYIKEYYNN